MSPSPTDAPLRGSADPDGPGLGDAGPLGLLPHLSGRQVRLQKQLARLGRNASSGGTLLGLDELLGPGFVLGPAEVLWRASGTRRPAMVAQLSWPRLATRLALGLETPIAHALVDRLLGFERLDVAGRLQLTPVEWGVLTFLLARGLVRLAENPGPLGPWDVVLDRAGPDPFDSQGLGTIVTVKWEARLGPATGAVRLWLPESLVALWVSEPAELAPAGKLPAGLPLEELSGLWIAEAGVIEMPRGLARLRVGGVLPLVGSSLRGTPQSPSGRVALAHARSGGGPRYWFPTEPVPHSGGGLLTVQAPARRDLTPREALALNPSPEEPTGGAMPPTDIPVTLTVELGRLNLALARLADLKPGDVLELGRHAREPVELTSGGRLVARGELVLIDTELGVRVTSVFL